MGLLFEEPSRRNCVRVCMCLCGDRGNRGLVTRKNYPRNCKLTDYRSGFGIWRQTIPESFFLDSGDKWRDDGRGWWTSLLVKGRMYQGIEWILEIRRKERKGGKKYRKLKWNDTIDTVADREIGNFSVCRFRSELTVLIKIFWKCWKIFSDRWKVGRLEEFAKGIYR